MNEFLLIFRRDYTTESIQPDAAQMQAHRAHWQAWFAWLGEQDLLARPVQRLDGQGQVLSSGGTIAEGPYREVNQSIGGFVIIKADSYEAAGKIAQGCPILAFGGSVEIRSGN